MRYDLSYGGGKFRPFRLCILDPLYSDNSSLPRQTVNSALKKLEKDGYLTLQRIEGKISKSIHLTKQGQAFVQKYIVPVMGAEERACELFSDEEKELFLKIFRTLVDRLNEEISNVIPEET